jgi:ABC-type polysaccharide/polyol phosphate export permease
MLFFSFIPILGLSLAVGALVLKFKEIHNVINVLQFVLGSLMGIFFPITLLPIFVQYLAITFPGTWIAQDIRFVVAGSPPMATLLGIEALIGNQSLVFDGVMLVILALVWGYFGWNIFSRTLTILKEKEGLGAF